METFAAKAPTLNSGIAHLLLWLIVVYVLVAGVVVGWARMYLEGSAKKRAEAGTDTAPSGAEPDRSIVRSWLAIALVGGLLIFAAVSFSIDDTTIRSTLIGGVVASAGAATAFYFASKASDQARKDILGAIFQQTVVPNLSKKNKAAVDAVIRGLPQLTYQPSPDTAADDWVVTDQVPKPGQAVPPGTIMQVTFASKGP